MRPSRPSTRRCSIEPKQAKFLGIRGLAWLRKGDYARGAADLKAAIELNPGDAGLRYRPSLSVRLSAEAMEHGRRQVARMLHDRPVMAQFEKQSEFLRDWAARKFAGEDFGELIDWDPSPPLHSDAEHLAPGDGEHAAILVEEYYTAGPNADAAVVRGALGRGGLRIAQRLLGPRVCSAERRSRARESVERSLRGWHLEV